MSKETIGCDLDNFLTFTAQHWVAGSNQLWNTDLTVDSYGEDWPRIWECDLDEARYRASIINSSEVVSTYPPFPDAPPTMARLSEAYRLVVITSRPALLRDCTIDWIDRHFPNAFEGVYFAGMWDHVDDQIDHDIALYTTKEAICEELGIEHLVDDEPKHCRGALGVGVKPVLYGDYNWNRHQEVPEGIIRVADMAGVEAHYGSAV